MASDRPRRTLRGVLASWVFVAAFLPAALVLVTTVVLLEPRSVASWGTVLAAPVALLGLVSAGFAISVARHVTGPLLRVRAIAVLASRPGGDTGNIEGAAGREPYAETAAVIRSLMLLRARGRAEVERRDRLASYVAHDMRTPIAAVAMHLLNDVDAEQRQALRDELSRVLDDLDQLVASLRSTSESEPPSVATDVVVVVREAIDACIVPSGVTVELVVTRTFATSLPRAAVWSVVLNMVSNACRSAARRVTIEIAPGRVQVSNDVVSDSEGARASSQVRRHGLGLAAARHALATHGGHLRVVHVSDDEFSIAAFLPLAEGYVITA